MGGIKIKALKFIILLLAVIYVGHYYYIHSSTKRVFDTQKQLRPIEYIDTIYDDNDAYTLAVKPNLGDDYIVYAAPMHRSILGWRIVRLGGSQLKLNGSGALVLGKEKQISFGIIDSKVKEVRYKGKKFSFIKYGNKRIWYYISEPTNQVSKTRPSIIYK
jgi:hypothetical protein